MADVVRRPTFLQAEIERQRQQALSSLKVAAEDPESVAGLVIDRLIFGFHPYGLPGSGTAESLQSLTRADFVDFHKRYFVPNNALVAVVGDISAGGCDGRHREVLRRLGRRATCRKFAPIAPPEPTKRVIVIDRPDAVQTEIRVGHLGDAAQARRLRDARSGGEDSRRRGRQPAAAGAAQPAAAHLRRLGRSRRLQVLRRDRRRDRHADAPTPPRRCE